MAIHQKNNKKDSAGYLIKKTMNKQLTKTTAAIFVRNWANIAAFFDPKVLTQAVHQFKVRDFATFDYVRREHLRQLQCYDAKGYILLTPEPVMAYVTEYSNHDGGGWERRVQKLCYEYIVADNYQCREKDLIMAALLLEFPYLAKYGIQAYHMDKGCTRKQIEEYKKKRTSSYFTSGPDNYFGDEIYVHVKDKYQSLYVPYLALKERNPDMIVSRHTKYHQSYYNGSGREEALKHSLEVLDTKEAKRFLKHVKEGK